MSINAPLIAALASLVLSLLLPYAIRPVLIKLRIIDVPSFRSSHDRPILRGLGLAVLLALVVAGSFSIAQLFAADDYPNTFFLLTVGVFSLFSGFLGFAEDVRGVSVGVRSILLLLIAGGASALIVTLGYQYSRTWRTFAGTSEYSSHPAIIEFFDLPIWLLVLIAVYGVFFISGYINVANFMDGLNGISGLHGIVAGLTFAVTGWLMGMQWLLFAGLLLATAFAGFLPWNLSRRGAFLGDVGSYLLGGSVAITSFAALAAGVPLLATIGPMVIYFGDGVVTLVRRVRAGYKWDEPHKEHTYQRLQQQGRSHIRSSLIVAFFSLLTSALGVASMFVDNALWFLFLAGGIAVLIFYLNLPKKAH